MFRRTKDRYFCSYILTQPCTLRQYAMRSKFAALIIQDFFHGFFLFAAHRLLTRFGASSGSIIKEKKYNMNLIAALCLFMGTSPLYFALLGIH